MLYKTIISFFVIISFSFAANAQNGSDLYHDNGTIAFDSSYHCIYYNNKQAIYNKKFKKYNYKDGKTIFEPSYKNIYYSDGNIAYNGMFKKVYYQNGILAYDEKKQTVFDNTGNVLINFNTSSEKQFTIQDEFLSVTIIPNKDFLFKFELTEEQYIYSTDFKTYFKISKRNSNDNSDELLRTLKLK